MRDALKRFQVSPRFWRKLRTVSKRQLKSRSRLLQERLTGFFKPFLPEHWFPDLLDYLALCRGRPGGEMIALLVLFKYVLLDLPIGFLCLELPKLWQARNEKFLVGPCFIPYELEGSCDEPLGETLKRLGLVSDAELERALEQQQSSQERPFIGTLLANNVIDDPVRREIIQYVSRGSQRQVRLRLGIRVRAIFLPLAGFTFTLILLSGFLGNDTVIILLRTLKVCLLMLASMAAFITFQAERVARQFRRRYARHWAFLSAGLAALSVQSYLPVPQIIEPWVAHDVVWVLVWFVAIPIFLLTLGIDELWQMVDDLAKCKVDRAFRFSSGILLAFLGYAVGVAFQVFNVSGGLAVQTIAVLVLLSCEAQYVACRIQESELKLISRG